MTADDPLFSLHRLLVRALRDRDPKAVSRPFTVAEIYQDLVPYRRYRDLLGVDMNGDYEHILLRLLSGEGDLVRLDSKPAVADVVRELEAANPNTGIYREYAAADVRLVKESLPDEDDDPRGSAGSGADGARSSDAGDAVDDVVAPKDRSSANAAAARGEGMVPEHCPWCREALPARPGLRFCPHCGKDPRVVPCPTCGEALEPEWRFCIGCGEEVGAG